MPSQDDGHDHRTAIKVAFIGVIGTVLAAVVGGMFLVLSDDSGPATPPQQSAVPPTTNQSPAPPDGPTTTSVSVGSTMGEWVVSFESRTFRFPCESFVVLDLDIPSMSRPSQGKWDPDVVYHCSDEEIGRFKYSDAGQLSVANPSPEECNAAVDQQPADKLRVREGLRFCVRTAEGLIGFLEVVQVSGGGVLSVQARAWESASDSVGNG
jgi:hypothetical protein